MRGQGLVSPVGLADRRWDHQSYRAFQAVEASNEGPYFDRPMLIRRIDGGAIRARGSDRASVSTIWGPASSAPLVSSKNRGLQVPDGSWQPVEAKHSAGHRDHLLPRCRVARCRIVFFHTPKCWTNDQTHATPGGKKQGGGKDLAASPIHVPTHHQTVSLTALGKHDTGVDRAGRGSAAGRSRKATLSGFYCERGCLMGSTERGRDHATTAEIRRTTGNTLWVTLAGGCGRKGVLGSMAPGAPSREMPILPPLDSAEGSYDRASRPSTEKAPTATRRIF